MLICQGLCRHLVCLSFLALVWQQPRLTGVSATIFHGELSSFEPNLRHFVGKYVYDYKTSLDSPVGTVMIETKRIGPALTKHQGGRLLFAIFDDERSHWKKVKRHWSRRTCDELVEAASIHTDIDLASPDGETRYTIQVREHIRPRFWYFSFIACDVPLTSEIEYEVHAENIMWSWQKEFSLDHMGLFQCHAILAVLFPVALLCTVLAARGEHGPELKDHPYVQLLLLSYGASWASSCFFIVHYALFMHDGFGSRRIRFLGVLASIVANCTIFLIAIFSSVGWAISTAVLPHRRVFLGAVALTGGLNGLLELHAETATDLSTKLYSYQSGPGLFALILKIFMTCWFCFQIRVVYDEELQEKRRRFYKVLGIAFSAWSLHVPVAVLVCFVLAPYVRYKVVTIIDIVARFVGQVLLSQLLCGPLTPLSYENIFHARDEYGTETSFAGLHDGPDGNY